MNILQDLTEGDIRWIAASLLKSVNSSTGGTVLDDGRNKGCLAVFHKVIAQHPESLSLPKPPGEPLEKVLSPSP